MASSATGTGRGGAGFGLVLSGGERSESRQLPMAEQGRQDRYRHHKQTRHGHGRPQKNNCQVALHQEPQEHQHEGEGQESLVPESHIEQTTEAAFICAICSRPQYPPGSPSSPNTTTDKSFGPTLIGNPAVITCQDCWRAVLDLSICWVCGECIVPGSDVVSLGWCFWHRGCFGCLMCGKKVARLAHDDYGGFLRKCRWESGNCIGVSRKRKKNCVGSELDEVPLCGVCEAETTVDDQALGIQKGCQSGSRFDGGASEIVDEGFDELQTSPESLPRRFARRFKRVRGATGIESELGRFINRSSALSQDPSDCLLIEDRSTLLWKAANPGLAEDGACDCHSDEEESQAIAGNHPSREEQPPIYVSSFQATGNPPLAPQPIKPLPSWMALLPANVEKAREKRERQERQAAPSPEPSLSRKFTDDDFAKQQSSRASSSTSSTKIGDGLRLMHSLTVVRWEGSKTRSDEAASPIDIPRPKRRVGTSISFNDDELNSHPRSSRRSQSSGLSSSKSDASTHTPRVRRTPTPFPETPSPPTPDFKGSPTSVVQGVALDSTAVCSGESGSEMQACPHAQKSSDSSTASPTSSGRSSVAALSSSVTPRDYPDKGHPQPPASLQQKVFVKMPKLQVSEKIGPTRPSDQASAIKNDGGEDASAEANFNLKRVRVRDELRDLFARGL